MLSYTHCMHCRNLHCRSNKKVASNILLYITLSIVSTRATVWYEKDTVEGLGYLASRLIFVFLRAIKYSLHHANSKSACKPLRLLPFHSCCSGFNLILTLSIKHLALRGQVVGYKRNWWDWKPAYLPLELICGSSVSRLPRPLVGGGAHTLLEVTLLLTAHKRGMLLRNANPSPKERKSRGGQG